MNFVNVLFGTWEKWHLSNFMQFAHFSSKSPSLWKTLRKLAVPSDWRDRPEACTYTQPWQQAFKQMIQQTKVSSTWINGKVKFGFQNFFHVQAWLQSIYSPVFQYVSL